MSIESNKRNKYLRTRLIQSAVSGNIDMFADLSQQIQEKIDYSLMCYYAIRHNRLKMANYLISMGGHVGNYQFNKTNKIPTAFLTSLISGIKDSDPIYKYKEYLTDLLCDICFRKRYADRIIISLNFYENGDKIMSRVNRYKEDLCGSLSQRDIKFLESFISIDRNNSIEKLLDI